MRKLIDTMVLLLLLLGPAVVLTCVRPETITSYEAQTIHHKDLESKALQNVVVAIP
jgi:hypothetical protein